MARFSSPGTSSTFEAIMQHFRDLFQSDRASGASCASTFPGTISESEVHNALFSIRIGKTVPARLFQLVLHLPALSRPAPVRSWRHSLSA